MRELCKSFNRILTLCVALLSAGYAHAAPLLISISNPPPSLVATAAGDSQFWQNAGTLGVNGTPISLRATVQSISAGDSISLFTSGDNPVVRANTGTLSATILWEVFDRNTGLPISGDPDFLITDIDGRSGTPIESVSAACAGLTSYTTNGVFLEGCNANSNNACDTNIRVSESNGSILAEGTQNQSGNQQEGYMQYSWTDVSSWTVTYIATSRGRWYIHDADGDIPFDGTQVDINLVDLATIKGVTPTSLTAPAQGELITFQIDLSNAGPAPATAANLTDLLPAGDLSYQSHTTTSGSYNPSNGQWTGVNVAVNGTETLTITAEVLAPANQLVSNVTTTALAAESVCSSRDLLEYSFTVAETPAPSMTINKSVDPITSFSAAGDTITYRYEVMNTGNVNISGVTPDDNGPTFGGQPATNALSVFSPASATLAPGQTQIFTATYLLDQADVDNMAGDTSPLQGIDNTATATGVPSGGVLPAVTPSTVETGFAPSPNLSILKSVTGATVFDGAGDTITYQYEVTNTGNITIDAVSPVDSGPTFNGMAGVNTLSAFSPASVSLAPGASQIFTSTYLLDQADVDNMAVSATPLTAIANSASATGNPVGATALPAVPSSTANTGFALTPVLTVNKAVSNATTFSQAGDTITYSYMVQNTGNVTINNVVPVDAGPTFAGNSAANSLSAFSPSSVTLAPGSSQAFTATYLLDQADVDFIAASANPALAISNTASVQGVPVGGVLAAVTPSTATTGFAPTTGLSLTKTAGAPSVGLGSNTAATDAGDTIAYSFEVTNTGQVSLSNIQVNDLGVTFNSAAGTGTMSAITCPQTTLQPNQTTTCTATYTLSQVDVDNAVIGGVNAVENSANASGEDPANATVTSANDSATTSIATDSSISLTKSAAAPTIGLGTDPTIVDPGDTIAFSVAIENTGNTTLSNVTISDTLITLTCPATTALSNAFANNGADTLAVGDSITCAANYVLTQPNLNAGSVTNTASVSSTDPTGAVIGANDTVSSGFTQKAAVALTKSGTGLPPSPSMGDPITYTFELTNTGNVTLTAAQVSDPLCDTPASPLTRASGYVGGDAGVTGDMEAGETWVFECNYPITQPNIDAGEVSNTAVGTGTPPASSGLTAPTSQASNLADANQNAAISLIKTAALPTVAGGSITTLTDEGDTVSYTFEVENTGNLTLTNVVVSDPLITGAPNNGSINCPAGVASMAPGDTLTCTATYTLQQSDIDVGQVANTAQVTGTPPVSVPPVDAPVTQSSSVATVTPLPSLSILKTADPLPSPFAANSTITYNYTVTNTGNVTITGAVPVDLGPTFNGSTGTNSLSAFNPLSVDLSPGQSQAFTATYTVSQADLDNLSQAADQTTAIDNSATATGTPALGALAPVTPSAVETGVALPASLGLIKTSTAPAVAAVGAEIVYGFALQNTGQISISDAVIDDAQCTTPGGLLSFTNGYVSGDANTAGVLEPGETWLFECRYALTQADVDAGTVQNSAQGSGQTPSGATIQDTSDSGNAGDGGAADDDPTNTALVRTPSWTVTKSTSSVPMAAGDTLVYDFLVDNTGNVSISNVTLSDAKCDGGAALISGDNDNNLLLDPAEVWTYRCTSIAVTLAEANAGMVDNSVSVAGTPPAGAPALANANDAESTPLAPNPALTLVKSASAASTGLGSLPATTDAGDTIVYTFDVTNSGNVTLSSVGITDAGPNFGLPPIAGTNAPLVASCISTTLLPTQSTQCTATYVLSQLDVDRAIQGGADSVTNSATAQGTPPSGPVVNSLSASATQSITALPEMEVLKVAGAPTVVNGPDATLTDPGDTVDFTITVENTGNTTLSNVTVSDSLTTVSCNANALPSNAPFTNGTGSLAVGDTVTCSATYVLNQSNVNTGQVVNTASVTAQDPSGASFTRVSEAIASFALKASLSLSKTSNTLPTTPAPVPGMSSLTYTFELLNTGNVTLSDVAIADPFCQTPTTPLTFTNGYVSGDTLTANGLLDAGETWTFSCVYVVTADDINDGEISNVATATGTPPPDSGLDAPSSTASNLAQLQQNSGLSLDKVSGTATQVNGSNSQVGDTVPYTFNIRNTGNVTLTDITLTDPLITGAPNNGSLSCVRDDGLSTPFDPMTDSLNALDSLICTGSYTLQQTDIDAGSVVNQATISGTPPPTVPPAAPPTAVSGSVAPVAPDPRLSIVKTASAIPTTVLAGDTITFSYEVQNTGNVTITDVAPVDLGPTFDGIAGTNGLSPYSPVTADLAPGDIQIFTATYVISQIDLDNLGAAASPASAISNSASVDGQPANGPAPTSTPSTVDTGVVPDPSLELIKTSTPPAVVRAGALITYTFTLENNGNVTISNPQVNDAQCQAPAAPLTFSNGYVSGDTGVIAQSLDVGETWTFRCDYAITQADIDAGTVQNTANAVGQDPAGNNVMDDSDSGNTGDDTGANSDATNTALTRFPSWTVAKSTTSTPSALGDTLNYEFLITNTGNVSISGVVVTDAQCQAAPALIAATDVGSDNVISPAGAGGSPAAEQWRYTCTSVPLLQADLDAGEVDNMVTVNGTAPGGNPPEISDTITTPISTVSSLSLVKSAGVATLNDDGTFDQIFNFALANTGNVTLSGVVIGDNIPAQFGSCVDQVISTGTLALVDVAPAADSSAPALGIAPTLASSANLSVGDQITLSNYVVRFDPNAVGCTFPATPLNTATASATTTTAGAVQDVSDNGVDPLVGVANSAGQPTPFAVPTYAPQLGMSKAAGTPSQNADGTIDVAFTLLVENTGNVDIDNLSIVDDLVGQYGTAFTASSSADTTGGIIAGPVVSEVLDAGLDNLVLPAASSSYDGTAGSNIVTGVSLLGVGDRIQVTFTVRLNPYATGAPAALLNTATASGSDPAGTVVNDNSNTGADPTIGAGGPGVPTTVTPPAFTLSLDLNKSAAAPSVGFGNLSAATDPGDTIVYTFDVTNNSNVTLSSVGITDAGPNFGSPPAVGTNAPLVASCVAATLAPTQSTQCTATYVLSQLDIDRAIAGGANSIGNTATAQGTPPSGPVVNSSDASATQSITAMPDVEIIKVAGTPTTANGPDATLTDTGDTVDFTITVENTGNTTLSNVAVSDNLTAVTCNANALPSNAPFTNGTGSLAVGDTITCSATYVLDQDDLNAGQVTNTASVMAQDPTGASFTETDQATSGFSLNASLSLSKTSNTLPPVPVVGVSTLTYTFELLNTGNVTLSSVEIDDTLCQTPTSPLTFASGYVSGDTLANGLLDAGETWIFNCDYVVTQNDINAGEVSNMAMATGMPPASSGLAAPNSASSNLADAQQTTGLSLDKTSSVPTQANGSNSQVGDTIPYTFTIQNTGNVSLTDIALTDPLITDPPNSGAFNCVRNDMASTPFDPATDTLDSMQELICSGSYTLQQTDIDAGSVDNQAMVTGTPPLSVPPLAPPSSMSSNMATVMPDSRLSIVKSASVVPVTVIAGDEITYSYRIENTGNVTVSDIVPVDVGPTFNGMAGTNSLSAYSPLTVDLAPGEFQVFTASYALSQNDLDNMAAAAAPDMAISNEATAAGTSANGPAPTVTPDTVDTGVAAAPSLELIKASTPPTIVQAGALITYTFTLENTGNVTISNPLVNDAECQTPVSPLTFNNGYVSGDTGVIAQSLDVGETWTFSCDYAITQADIDAGTVQNTAEAVGQDPATNDVRDDSDSGNAADDTGANSDPTNTALARTASWTVAKSTTSTPNALNDTLNYEFLISNTGNVSISGVVVTDAQCQAAPVLVVSSDVGGDNVISPAGVGDVPAAEQWRYTCTSDPLQQADLDAGEVDNTVTVNGTAPGGNPPEISDTITTPINTTSSLSLVKSAGAATLNDDGTFDQSFNFALANTGNVTLNAVSIVDNIPAQFGVCVDQVLSAGTVALVDLAPLGDSPAPGLGLSPTLASSVSLSVGDRITLSNYVVRFSPNATGCNFPVTPMNTATANATTTTAGAVQDVSDNGIDPAAGVPNSAGVPTPFSAPVYSPQLGLSKAAGSPLQNADGTIDVVFNLLVENTGNVDIDNLSVLDDLVTQYGAAFTASSSADTSAGIVAGPVVTEVLDAGIDNLVLPTGSSAYDGSAGSSMVTGTSLLGVGDRIQVTFTARINPYATGAPAMFLNTATVSGSDPAGTLAMDNSNDGSNPATGAGGPGMPTTVLAPPLVPALELIKASTLNTNGTISYEFVINNIGNVNVSDVSLTDLLLDPIILPAMLDSDGDGDIDVIMRGDSVTVMALYTITPVNITAGRVTNAASISGMDPAGTLVNDDSDSGNPADDTGAPDDPTITTFTAPNLGVAKALQAGSPVDLGDGTYQVTYEFVISNTGGFDLPNVQLEDDLNAMINNPNPNNATFSSPLVTSPNNTLTPNANYDGSSDIGLLSGSDALLAGETARVNLSFNFDPAVYFGPFLNQAIVSADDLSGVRIQDLSENGSTVNANTQSPSPFLIATPSTPITLGWFQARAQGGAVLFEWATEVEVSNAGFELLYRDSEQQWQLVSADMIPAKGDSTDIQTYQYLAAGTSAQHFKLVDVSVTGNRIEHGPFTLGEIYGAKVPRKRTNWDAFDAESDDKRSERMRQRQQKLDEQLRQFKPATNKPPRESSQHSASMSVWSRLAGLMLGVLVPSAHAMDVATFTVEEPGLYRVAHVDLMAKGIDLRGIELARLNIHQANEVWPLMIESPNSSSAFDEATVLIFPGQGLSTLYTGVNKYTLVLDEGAPVRVQSDDRPIPSDTAPAASYLAEASYAPQNYYTHLSPSREDSWYADRLRAINGPVSKRVVLQLNDYAPALNHSGSSSIARQPRLRPRMEVNLWGNSNLPGNGVTAPDHRVQVQINGEPVADARFDGLVEYPVRAVPSVLQAGQNTLDISLPRDHGYRFDLVNLDRVSLFYPRRLNAQNSGTALVFESAWPFFKLSKLASNSVTVVRVDQARKGHIMTQRYQGSCQQGCAYFAGSEPDQIDTYYVATDAGYQTPEIEVAKQFNDLFSNPARYLIIAHPDFIDTPAQALEVYAEQLRQRYQSVDIVNVEDVYQQYSGGVLDAYAISTYVQDAFDERGTRHLMLVGGDMYDYKNYLNTNAQSFVPSIYVHIASNVNAVPSDAKYADVDGDNVPDLTVTRLPVRNTEELERLVNKRTDYLARGTVNRAIFAADKVDNSGYSFKADLQHAVNDFFGGWQVDTVYLDDVSLSEGRRSLVSALNQGASLVSYSGHSSTDRWAISGLLTGNDVASLNNVNNPVVVTQWGCWNTFYVSPEQDSLAHRFLVETDAGAVTVMGASSFTRAEAERKMADLLFPRLQNGMTIGEAVLSAKRELAKTNPYQLDVLLGWAVLGPDDLTITAE